MRLHGDMATEIERRYLLLREPDLGDAVPETITQGYISDNPEKTVRIRRRGDEAFLTIKGLRVNGAAPEFEYPIPVADADEMLARFCTGNGVAKARYTMPEDGLTWEVDVFAGPHHGLIIAEVELPDIRHPVIRPDWLFGHEITNDNRFANAALATLGADAVKSLVDEYRRRLPPVGAMVPKYRV